MTPILPASLTRPSMLSDTQSDTEHRSQVLAGRVKTAQAQRKGPLREIARVLVVEAAGTKSNGPICCGTKIYVEAGFPYLTHYLTLSGYGFKAHHIEPVS